MLSAGAVRLARHMPVVEKIVVQQRAAHQCTVVQAQTEKEREAQTDIGNVQTVQIDAGRAVLHIVFLRANRGGRQNGAAVAVQQM